MSDNQSTRRKFLRFLGLSAGASLVSTGALAGFVDKDEILKLNPAQQEFMMRYGKWMDEFAEASRQQKVNPKDKENLKKIMELSDKVDAMKPELREFMKDKTFAIIYKASIDRVTKEIE